MTIRIAQDRIAHMLERYVHAELPVARIQYFEASAQKFLEEYGTEFKNFASDLDNLRRRGDYRVKTIGATGYNLLRTSSAMDLQSNDLLLFYNNDIYNPHHFGLLLAELEYDGLIQENEITFGVKSSSVIFERVERGGHEWDLPTTVNTRIIRRKTKSGKEDEVVIQDSLELVLAIRARDEEHAVKLAKFFNERTKLSASLQGEAAIDGSWVVPDIRATNNLSEFLIEHAGYIPVIANLGRMGELV